jgi:hypothetical protein
MEDIIGEVLQKIPKRMCPTLQQTQGFLRNFALPPVHCTFPNRNVIALPYTAHSTNIVKGQRNWFILPCFSELEKKARW